jgi:hypothetical protein
MLQQRTHIYRYVLPVTLVRQRSREVTKGSRCRNNLYRQAITSYEMLVGMFVGKQPLGSCSMSWKDGIKMNVSEINGDRESEPH